MDLGFRSKEEEKEVFLRLWERFVDPREALVGEVPIPGDFNLGEYFILVRFDSSQPD